MSDPEPLATAPAPIRGCRPVAERERRRSRIAAIVGLAVAVAAGCRRESPPLEAAPANAKPVPSRSAVPSAPSAPFASASAAERAWTRPFLWRVTPPPSESWVFGTMHIPDRRLDLLPAGLERAMAACDGFYAEIPLDPATQAHLATSFLLPGGQTLEEVLPPELYARVEREWTSRGLGFVPFDGMKPWVVSIQVTLLDRMMLMAVKKPLDAALYARAEAANKEVGGLETAAEQIAVFDELTRSEQTALLRDTLDQLDRYRKERRDPTEELVSAYVSGEDARIIRILHEEYDPKDPLDVKIQQRVFAARNARMSARIADKLRAGRRSFLFAVGAGHVVGEDGIVARLARAGFQPVRVVD
ncbi:MAG: TraB/GumN family protein [Polyangiaceae bacterium]|nr:TraB/GumN family protein [Polyangiaceae bacterium]